MRLLVLLALCAGAAFGDEIEARIQVAVTSEIPRPGRFQVIQSSLVARQMFKVDTHTGRVWQWVNGGTDESPDLYFSEVDIHPVPERSVEPRYQLFLSGIVARNVFLLDTKTGTAWAFYRDPKTETMHFAPADTPAPPPPVPPTTPTIKPWRQFIPPPTATTKKD